VAIAVANVIGGASYPAQKLALEGLPPASVTCVRNLVSLAALLVLFGRRTSALASWTRAERLRAGLLGTAAFALPMWLGIVGVERSSSGNASILVLLEPVTIVLIVWLVLGERVGPIKLAGVALALLGALCLVLEGASPGDLLGSEHMAGNAILALHGVLWGCYTPLAKPLVEKRDPVLVTLVSTAAAVAMLVPAALAERARWHAGPGLGQALALSAAIGLVVSFGSVLLWLWALRHIPSTSVAGFVFLQPLSGVLIGSAFLGEPLSRAALLGGALIVLGVALDVVTTAAGGGERRAPVPEVPRAE
jgi:drug/metabolite transporter (DMT)-like permease